MIRLTPRFRRWLQHRRISEALRQRRKWSEKQTKHFVHRGRRLPVIVAPPALSFGNDYDTTAEFFCAVRNRLDGTTGRGSFLVEMAPIRTIGTAGALCLVAEFDRWQRLYGKPLYPFTLKRWDREVIRRLSDMGFFQILGTRVPPALRDGGPEARRFLRFFSSVVVDPKATKALRDSVGEPTDASAELSLGLYRSIGEAIANSVEHAYPEEGDFPDRMGRRWWLTGSLDFARSRLNVVLLDHGISIPGSLPRSRHKLEIGEYLMRMFRGEEDDGKVIEAAMEHGRSRLKQPQRGKGLGDVLELALAHPTNRLRVISRNGYFVFENGVARSETRTHPLNRTLVQWDLAVPPRTTSPHPQEG